MEIATFAGGCFWCMETAFVHLPGVVKVVSGYTGGDFPNPTYQDLHSKNTGHFEAVQVTYNPEEISYKRLLQIYWWNIDPTDPGGQFADRGDEYKTAIFYHTDQQKKLAVESKQILEASGKLDKPIVTQILAAKEFYPAEDYHQEYYKNNPLAYQRYRFGSGREAYVKSNKSYLKELEDDKS